MEASPSECGELNTTSLVNVVPARVGATSGRTPRRRYSTAEKLAVVEAARNESVARVAIRFNVSRSSVVNWRNQESELRSTHPVSLQKRYSQNATNRTHGLADPEHPQQEQQLRDSNMAVAFPSTGQSREQRTAASSTMMASLPTTLVAFCGQHETLSEVACKRWFQAFQHNTLSHLQTISYPSFNALLDAVQKCDVNYGIIARDLVLSSTFSSLLREIQSRPLHIVNEVSSPDKLCLAALAGSSLNECECVMTDLTSLYRCEYVIANMERNRGAPILRQAAWDSAGASRTIADERVPNVAVVCSENAARAAQLEILKNDVIDSETSYLILGHLNEPVLYASIDSYPPMKSTLLLAVRNQPNWILQVARIFADQNVHLVDFESHVITPSTSCIEKCVVVLSYLIQGSTSSANQIDLSVRAALAPLVEWIKHLGTYPTYSTTASIASRN